jgi:prolipoprotein diacylglyceryltransferase
MNDNKIMKQMTAIFSLFMVFFYLGVGIFLIFFFDSKQSIISKPVVTIFGVFCIFYGLYRAYTTYVSIVKLFFRHQDEDDEQ